mmetsp:Transcript_138078/g.240135  ORF Transcript_138078/g.240135 Transcript_138078/m.240135 type:complete len:260 (+) Transcript_138078:88-867(+)
MQRIAIALACLACVGHGRRAPSSASSEELQGTDKALAKLFLALNPRATFQLSGNANMASLRHMSLDRADRGPTMTASTDSTSRRALLSSALLGAAASFVWPSAAHAFDLPPLDQFYDFKKRAKYENQPNPSLSKQQQEAFFALTTEDLFTFQQMIDNGWDLANAKDSAGKTSMHRAAQLGNPIAIEKMTKAGIPVDPVNQWKETPLHFATRNGKLEAVKALVEAGANIKQEDGSGDNSLSLATKYRFPKVAEYLASVSK